MTKTGFDGYYEVTDKAGPSETEFQCSCGVLIWDVEAHAKHHARHGELCQVKKQA